MTPSTFIIIYIFFSSNFNDFFGCGNQGDQIVGFKSRPTSIKSCRKITKAVFARKMKDIESFKVAQQFGPYKCTRRL